MFVAPEEIVLFIYQFILIPCDNDLSPNHRKISNVHWIHLAKYREDVWATSVDFMDILTVQVNEYSLTDSSFYYCNFEQASNRFSSHYVLFLRKLAESVWDQHSEWVISKEFSCQNRRCLDQRPIWPV